MSSYDAFCTPVNIKYLGKSCRTGIHLNLLAHVGHGLRTTQSNARAMRNIINTN